MCPNLGAEKQPPWPYADNEPETRTFQVNFGPTLDVKIGARTWDGAGLRQGLSAAGNLVVSSLLKGEPYEITLSDPRTNKECRATFVPDGTRLKPTFTRRAGSGDCIPASGGGTIYASLPP
jgi:hypothetical protein